MTSISLVPNIKVRGNNISGNTTYTYTHNFNLNGGAALIDGNNFAIPSLNANMLSLTDCNCTITNNTFVRGSTSITSYINYPEAAQQIITNNTFDKSTVNGTSDVLIVGLPAGSIYEKNINQVMYIPIFPSMELVGAVNAGADPSILPSTSIEYSDTTLHNHNLGYDLTANIPAGMQIISAKIGFGTFRIAVTFAGSHHATSMVAIMTNAVRANYTTGTGSILDVYANAALGTSVSGSTLDLSNVTLDTTTGYMTVDLSASSFYTSLDESIFVKVNLDVQLSAGDLIITISPLVVKCTW